MALNIPFSRVYDKNSRLVLLELQTFIFAAQLSVFDHGCKNKPLP